VHSLPGSLDSDVHPITLPWMSACPAANEQAPVALVSMQKHTEELLTYLEVLAEETSAQRLHGTGRKSSRSSTRRTSSDEKRGDRIPRADHPRHFRATGGITRRGHRMKEEKNVVDWVLCENKYPNREDSTSTVRIHDHCQTSKRCSGFRYRHRASNVMAKRNCAFRKGCDKSRSEAVNNRPMAPTWDLI
jgi:hypothetical protein